MHRNKRPTPIRFGSMGLRLAAVALVGVMFAAGGLTYAAHMENNSAFCASCHTQPETQYYQRSLDKAPVDLATAHALKNVACIQCHSGAGPAGRVNAMASVAAPDLIAYLSGHYRSPALTTVPIGDDHCLKCHAEVTTRRTFNNHFHYFLPLWQASAPRAAATCVDCHQSHITGGLPGAAFLTQATTVAVCQRCHASVGEGG